MTKRIVGLLLLANLAIFGWMRWGHLLTVDVDSAATQPALNPDRIKLLEMLPASAPTPASAPVPPGMTLTLSPVSAPAMASAPSAATASAPVAAEPPSQSSGATCEEWGEFSGSDLVRAQQALAALKLGDRLGQRNVEHNHGYWVYIPPLKNRTEVEKKISQLKERGVKDYFVVQEEGKWLNAISLGVFKTEEAAQKFLAALRVKGVRSAKVGERLSKLKFVVFTMKSLDDGTAARISALQKEFPGSEIKVSACNN